MKIDAFYVNAMKVEEDFAYHQVVQAKVTHLPLTESATGYSVGLKTAADAYNKAVEELDKVLEGSKSVPAALDAAKKDAARDRSEEHTSELQSHYDLVCRLLLEKK